MTLSGIGTVIFTSIKPILKMGFLALGGAFFARKGVLTPEVCRSNAGLVINLFLPLLMFSTVIPSFGGENMRVIGVLLLTAGVYMLMGLCFGGAIRWCTPVPKVWRGGVLAAGAYCNWGDLILAFITTIGKSKPFSGPKDIDRGSAYTSIFMVAQMVVIYNFGGINLIKRDFTIQEDLARREDPEKEKLGAFKGLAERTRKTTKGLVEGVRGQRFSELQKQPVRPHCSGDASEPKVVDMSLDTSSSIDGRAHVRCASEPQLPPPVAMPGTQRPAESSEFGSQSQTVVNTPQTASIRSHTEAVPLYKRAWQHLQPFLTPVSLCLVISLIIANVSPLKSLFVRTKFTSIPDAPDGKPPLDFVMEVCSFGGSSVPVIGMVLLGANLSRLTLESLPKGFWKSVVGMSLLKLALGPVIGVLWTTTMRRAGLVDKEDKMLQFVMILTAGVPTATSQVYLTNMFAPINSEHSAELSALSAMLLAQYLIMLLTLTALVSYMLLNLL